MKPGQISLSSLFWIVTLAVAIAASAFGAMIVGIPLGCVAAFVLADRYRKRIESDPAYIPPTEEEIKAKHQQQTKGCVASFVIVVVATVAFVTFIIWKLSQITRWN